MKLKNLNNIKLGVIGCGKMATAILTGVVNNSFLTPSNISVYDVNPNAANTLSDKYGFKTVSSIKEISEVSDVIFLATKPFVVSDVLNELKIYYSNALVLSILAGVKIDKYKSVIPNIKIARIMPNTPALINNAMSAVCPDINLSEDEIGFAFDFMKNCGEVIMSDEDKIDIITALSGSGPAFYYKIIQLFAQSASKLGLDSKQALLLSAQTALGSAKMVIENGFDINTLITNVTTPGGCTEVGNNIINSSNINKIFDEVIFQTAKKARDLG